MLTFLLLAASLAPAHASLEAPVWDSVVVAAAAVDHDAPQALAVVEDARVTLPVRVLLVERSQPQSPARSRNYRLFLSGKSPPRHLS